MKTTYKQASTKLLMAIAVVSLPFALSAQKNTPAASDDGFGDKWSIGVNGGLVTFIGDVKQYDFAPATTPKSELGYGAGLRLSRSLNYIFSIQGDGMYGTLAGESTPTKQSPSRTESIYFTGNFYEGSLSTTINLGNLVAHKNITQRKFTVYSSIGVGLGAYQTQLKTITGDTLKGVFGYKVDPNTGAITSKRAYEVFIPVALGVKYRISPRVDIGLETSLHSMLNTDNLDTRTAGNTNDKYLYTNLGFTFKLGHASDKDAWVNPLDGIPSRQDSLKQKVDAMTTDTDKDGVADLFDKDNTTPDGVKTYGDGSAVDSDMDGVPDYKDAEPFSTKGAKVDADGRELDSDGDGVPDSKDLEPNTPLGAMVNFQGRTIKVEEAKHDPGMAVYFPSIYFATSSSQIQNKYYENLAAVARVLKANAGVKIVITGHTDGVGSDATNDKLGQKRAKIVMDHLVKVYGIDASRLSVESKGKKDPLATKENSVNRRVDFNVK